jgi:hypothetical protein
MDYNDLVLRASAGVTADGLGGEADAPDGGGSAPAATAGIPLPPAAWPGAVSLVTVTYVAVRRYRKRP